MGGGCLRPSMRPFASHAVLYGAHQVINACTSDSDGNHSADHDRRLKVTPGLHDHVTQAGGPYDQFRTDKRLPAESGAHANAGYDMRECGWKENLGECPPAPRTAGPS